MTFCKVMCLLRLLCVGVVLSACGQKGDLYLPDPHPDRTQTGERISSKR
jgi:predicted small lipoprotein YifL